MQYCEINLFVCFYFIFFHRGFEMTHEGKVSKNLDELTRPRTMETHLPVQLLPDEIWTKKPYMIYISRDPRDVAVSTYYTAKEKFHMPLSKDEFLERFLKDQNVYAPYREHRLNFWNIPDYPNILYLTYEWITENIDDAIWKVAGFLGKTISEENFHKLREYLKDSMESELTLLLKFTKSICGYEHFFIRRWNQQEEQSR